MKLENGRPENTEGRLEKEIRVYDFLDKLGVEYQRVDHEAAMTMEACEEIDRTLGDGTAICKNLFLCNRQETDFYLLLMPGDKPFKTKNLSAQIGSARLSFAKPEYMEKVMKRYAYRDWDSVLASVGHGGLKEGQVINKMIEERTKKLKREVTDATILDAIGDNNKPAVVPIKGSKSKSGITVKGIHDLAVRFSKCCSPVPGDEIVGFVTRGRGITIHRTDCINVLNLPEIERSRLIDAEWQGVEEDNSAATYSTEISIFANNRIGMFVDISKIFTEREIDIKAMSSRVNKQGKATITMSFDIHGIEELNNLMAKLRQIDGVLDIERTTG